MDEELKKCPFCGGNTRLERINVPYAVGCDNSNCLGWYYKNWHFKERRDAIESWNKRANN